MARVGVQAVTHLVMGRVVDMVQGEEQAEVAQAVVLAVQTTSKAMLYGWYRKQLKYQF
jgi:hypothetical protein